MASLMNVWSILPATSTLVRGLRLRLRALSRHQFRKAADQSGDTRPCALAWSANFCASALKLARKQAIEHGLGAVIGGPLPAVGEGLPFLGNLRIALRVRSASEASALTFFSLPLLYLPFLSNRGETIR